MARRIAPPAALTSAVLLVAAAIGMVITVHFVVPDPIRDLRAGVGLLLCAILPFAAGTRLARSLPKSSSAQQSGLVLARVLLGLGLIASLIVGFATAVAVAFILADSPPYDQRGLDVIVTATDLAFYAALATGVLAFVMTLLIRVQRDDKS
jgi:hypothetical protein